MTAHRTYPPANGPWIIRQSWRNLLFAHWPVPEELLRPLIPNALDVDTFEGQAWIGIVPFRMEIAPRGLENSLFKRSFNELNVRTYVTHQGRHPGVWFFSLDAGDPLSVASARMFYKLPYFNAEATCRTHEDQIFYQSRRTHPHAPGAEFDADYGPISAAFQARWCSLEYWLTERYCLYTADQQGQIYSGEIHHAPWHLQPAQAEFRANRMTECLGIQLPDTAPHLLYSEHLEMIAWPIRRVSEQYLAQFGEAPSG
ncbi:MAG TPA: DUF2071 domain-containing protein [Coleofasciculaceae cyanobacterium]